MALYRTISDRGLWKKNQRNQDPQPQHFHKPQYIDHQGPQVTYSRLSLGEGYRTNSRQSIPDINKDIAAANQRFDQVYSSQSGRNFKSCPTTPRATTPTRYLSRSRATLGGQETDIDHGDHGEYLSSHAVISRSTFSRGSYAPSPYNTGSIYGQTFAEDDRYSFESRSLTAYSNYSERDSVIDSNYRYPYAREPAYNYQYQPEPRIIETRDNPVLQQVNNNPAYDANNVVNLFLQKSFFPNVTNNNDFSGDAPVVNGVKPSYNSNSTVSPVSDSQTEPSSATPVSSPGYNTRAAIAQLKKEFLSREPEKPALRRPRANKYLQNRRSSAGGQAVTPSGDTEDSCQQPVTVPAPPRSPSPPPIVALDREPGSRAPSAAPVAPVPVPGAAIESNLVTVAPVASVTCEPPVPARVPTPPVSLETTGAPQPGPGHNNSAVETGCPMEQAFSLSDTVQSQDIPKLHHAQLCSLPKDTTYSSSSFSSSEEDAVDSARSLMVSINPVSLVRSEVESVQVQRIEAPPQRQNIWGPSPRHSVQHEHLQLQLVSEQENPVTSMGDQIFTHSASSFHPPAHMNFDEEQHGTYINYQTEQVDSSVRATQYKSSRSVSFENALDTETEAEEAPQLIERESEDDPILLERSFQDPAFANFVDSQKEKSPEKPKKKGFLSSLFKKSSKRQQPYGDDYIHIERKLDIWENSESEADSKIHDMMDQSPRFHFLKGDASPRPPVDMNCPVPVVPMPGSPAARRLFPDNDDHDLIEDHNQLHRVEDHGTRQEMLPTPQNSYGQQYDERNHETIHSMKVSPALSHIKPNICEISKFHEEAQPSMDNSLPHQKPTSLDDLIDDFNKKQSVEISSPVSTEQPRFIPEHERTQEIDIDALLNLSDTPEETEEELLEEEEQGQFSFTSSTQQTIYQRELSQDQNTLASMPEVVDHEPVHEQSQNETEAYLDEEKRLEMEQTDLVKHNMALEQELRERENERMKIANDIGEISTEVTVHQEERPKSVNTSFSERKKPKSMFNFSSFRKPKNKELSKHRPNNDTHSPNQSLNESFQKQGKPEEVQQSTTEDDLATKIVREIQKSTAELDINQAPNQKPSFFNSNNLRKSVRGTNKKRNPKEHHVDGTEIEKDEPVTSVADNLHTFEDHPDLSLESRKEKKPGFFSLRSSSKDRKNQRRPVSEVEAPQVEEIQTITKSKSDSNGFGSLFGSKSGSKSQERQKRTSSSPQPELINGDLPQLPKSDLHIDQDNAHDGINDEFLDQVKIQQNEKKEKGKGFSLFGSNKAKPHSKYISPESKKTQNKTIPKTNPPRPTSKPPLPPSKPVSGLTDFFASQPDQHESPPFSQEMPVPINQSPAPPLNQTENGTADLSTTPLSSNSHSANRNQESFDTSDNRRVSDTLNDRKSSFLQSTLQMPPDLQARPQMPDPRSSQSPLTETPRPPSQAQVSSLNSSFSEDPVKLRQTGRQSGRFRKSSSGLAEPQRVSVQRPKSSLSPSGTGTMMNSLIVDSMTRPTTPHHPSQTGSSPDSQPSDQRKKSSTISRTESYRRARGTEDDRPKIVKRNDTYTSLPHQQGTNLRRGNSEDSLRNALDRDQQSGQMPRSKSRQEKKGECNVM